MTSIQALQNAVQSVREELNYALRERDRYEEQANQLQSNIDKLSEDIQLLKDSKK